MAKTPLEIKSLARMHTKKALAVLADIMEQPNAPPAARVMAAQALIDRGWGKASQTVEISGEIVSKVIRGPAIAGTAAAWTDDHVPAEHTEH